MSSPRTRSLYGNVFGVIVGLCHSHYLFHLKNTLLVISVRIQEYAHFLFQSQSFLICIFQSLDQI